MWYSIANMSIPAVPKRSPEGAPSGTQGLAKGVTILKPRVGRPNPYGLRWRKDGKQVKEYFASAKDRDTRAAQIRREKRGGRGAVIMSRADIDSWQAFKMATGGTPWEDVVAVWKASGQNTPSKLVKDAVKEYLATIIKRKESKDISAETYAQKKQKVVAFMGEFGERRLSDVTGGLIEEWIDDLGYEAPSTFNTYRKVIRAFLADIGVKDNPCDSIRIRDDSIEHVGILTVEQTRALFEYARKNRPMLLGRLALEAFAGLRFSSGYRLEKSDVKREAKGVLLPRHKTKTDRRYYLDGLPENLWAWYDLTDEACWALTPREYRYEKSMLFIDAGVPHPRNCLRHSFCTYHVAAYKNPGLTATLLTHRNQQKLWEHYNGRATKEEGLAYFGIAPGA